MFDIRLNLDDFYVTEEEILADLLYPADLAQRRQIIELENLFRLDAAPE
jgi:hypothetical protein